VSSEPAVLVLLRETLERELPGASAAIFFESLGAWGQRVPSSFHEIVDFVKGPLRASLSKRLDEERTKDIVSRIEYALRVAELPTQELVKVRARGAFDDETTASILPLPGELSVVVLSATGELAVRCGALFAREEVRVLSVRSAGDLARLPDKLGLAIVDASDLPRASPRAIASALRDIPIVLVWAKEADGSRDVIAAFERENVRTMAFASDEPPDPMIDVLRSRIANGRS
jgi:hypothetical protein